MISRHLEIASKGLCRKQGKQYFRGVARSRLCDGQSAKSSPACCHCHFVGCVLQFDASGWTHVWQKLLPRSGLSARQPRPLIANASLVAGRCKLSKQRFRPLIGREAFAVLVLFFRRKIRLGACEWGECRFAPSRDHARRDAVQPAAGSAPIYV